MHAAVCTQAAIVLIHFEHRSFSLDTRGNAGNRESYICGVFQVKRTSELFHVFRLLQNVWKNILSVLKSTKNESGDP